MQPRSIYWTAIVGDNWPAIAPGDWGALEAVVRNGAGELDVDGLEQARRDFESRVRASESLQPVKDDMLAQQGNSRELANALIAAAELLREFSELVHRTRNQILDIVDRATEAIARVPKGPDAEPGGIQAYRIVAAGRDEVADVISSALRRVHPPWLRAQAEIAESVGPVAAWRTTGHVAEPHALGAASPPSYVGPATDSDAGLGDETVGADAGLSSWLVAQHMGRSPTGSTPSVDVEPGGTEEAPAGSAADPEPFPGPMVYAPQEDSWDEAPTRAGPEAAVTAPTEAGTPGPDLRPAASAGPEVAASSGVPGDSGRAPGQDRVRSGPAAEPGHTPNSVRGADSADAVRGSEQRAHTGIEKAPSSAEMIRTVVGGAMAAAATPAFEVGGVRVDGDLVLARTILGGMLSAIEPSWSGVGFAVSVMRHPGGVRAFVTSNEGRGWLPAGLYLPRATSTPARWVATYYSAWEGISDPARVLAEFGLVWGGKSGARLSALVSSQRIEPDMRRQLGEMPVEGPVVPSSAMPLAAPAPGLVDRLGLAGSPRLVDRVERVPAHLIGASCVELAWDAHDRAGQLVSSSAETLGVPALRERVLAAVRGGREVPAQWWEELRDIDDLLAATILAQRADVSGVPLGELRSERSGRSGPESAALRAMVFQRRCDELALMLAGPPDRQLLRDAVYAHGQVADHPEFAAAAPVSSAAASARAPSPGKRT